MGCFTHESDLPIEKHCTGTAGFTDHVFALMHLLGFRFAPRIRDLSNTNRGDLFDKARSQRQDNAGVSGCGAEDVFSTIGVIFGGSFPRFSGA